MLVARTRLVFGALTFFLWYAAMLSGMSILAMLTVRTFRELSTTVLVLLVLTALLWCTRRLMRRVLVKGAPSGASSATGSGPQSAEQGRCEVASAGSG